MTDNHQENTDDCGQNYSVGEKCINDKENKDNLKEYCFLFILLTVRFIEVDF